MGDAGTHITGIDVSPWQFKPYAAHDPDFHAVRLAGHRFVYAKASEGTKYRYNSFRAAWPLIAEAGLYRGAYHFLRWEKGAPDGATQARFFHDWVGRLTPGDLPPAMDLEWIKGQRRAADEIVACALDFMQACDELFGQWSIIYTGASFWRDFLKASKSAHKLVSWRRWQADYTGPLDPIPGEPDWPALIWQHTGDGECLGVSGDVDLNRFLGTEAELRQLAGLEPHA